jgi:hypothetical protein
MDRFFFKLIYQRLFHTLIQTKQKNPHRSEGFKG